MDEKHPNRKISHLRFCAMMYQVEECHHAAPLFEAWIVASLRLIWSDQQLAETSGQLPEGR